MDPAQGVDAQLRIAKSTGTTTLSYILNGEIHVVSDGRSMHHFSGSTPLVVKFVTGGRVPKIFMHKKKFLATRAGFAETAQDMIDEARNAADKGDGMKKIIRRLQRYEKSWVKKEENKNTSFSATIGLHYFGQKGEPSIQFCGSSNHGTSEEGSSTGSGNGYKYAQQRFKKLLLKEGVPQTTEQCVNLMKESVVATALVKPATGGFLKGMVFAAKRGARDVGEDKHIIHHVAENHERFKPELKKALLGITTTYPYHPLTDFYFQQELKAKVSGVQNAWPLGVNGDLTVRIVRFYTEHAAAEALELEEPLTDPKIQLKLELRRPSEEEFKTLAEEFMGEGDHIL